MMKVLILTLGFMRKSQISDFVKVGIGFVIAFGLVKTPSKGYIFVVKLYSADLRYLQLQKIDFETNNIFLSIFILLPPFCSID